MSKSGLYDEFYGPTARRPVYCEEVNHSTKKEQQQQKGLSSMIVIHSTMSS